MAGENETHRRRQLREFLMARRAAVAPQTVGLSPGLRRRTPGLRREELATLAGVGVTWYTWLEQGREIRVSADTLDRIATALRLTPTDTAHLFFLAGVGRAERPAREQTVDLDREIRAVLDAFQGPAFVIGPSWDIEGFNEIADSIYRFRDGNGAFGRNQIWRFFMDETRRKLYVDWHRLAEVAVGLFRTSYARSNGDPYFESLVRALTEGSAEFRQLWKAQRTAPMTPDVVPLLVPDVGEVRFTSMRLPLPGWDYHMLFLLPPADERSAEAIRRLAARHQQLAGRDRRVEARRVLARSSRR